MPPTPPMLVLHLRKHDTHATHASTPPSQARHPRHPRQHAIQARMPPTPLTLARIARHFSNFFYWKNSTFESINRLFSTFIKSKCTFISISFFILTLFFSVDLLLDYTKFLILFSVTDTSFMRINTFTKRPKNLIVSNY